MKKIPFLVLSALSMLIFSCSNNKEFAPTYKGQIDGGDWINSHTIVNFGGFTGDRCSKVDSVYQYSYGIRKLVKEISPKPIKKIKVSVWVKLEDLNKKTTLVVSVSGKDDKSIFWTGHDINPVVKEANKWFKFEIEDLFPEIIESDSAVVGVYVWNPNNNVAYVDDFEISFFEEE